MMTIIGVLMQLALLALFLLACLVACDVKR